VIIQAVDDNHPYIERGLKKPLLLALQDTPVVLLHGTRQTGKTTLARQIAGNTHPARYVTLDDATILAAMQHDPAGFLERTAGPLVLDEVQRIQVLSPMRTSPLANAAFSLVLARRWRPDPSTRSDRNSRTNWLTLVRRSSATLRAAREGSPPPSG
jgi:ABC-type sulfate/molybdate transport systems ATPase subunit